MALTALAPAHPDATQIEQVLVKGDLAALTEAQRVSYYNSLCRSLGLNPLTQPFQYLTLQGKLILYARRDATEQLRKIHGVSIERLEKERHDDLYVVTAYARDASGRTDASTGAVPLGTLKGEALANAIMKCETKAKRRVTLSICGLGLLDETEVDSVPNGSPVTVNVQTGEETTPTPALAAVVAPDGYQAWAEELQSVADEGVTALTAAFNAAKPEFRAYLAQVDRATADALKARARKAGAK
jgi:hypothetical protein